MNGPEILRLIRLDLQRTVTVRGRPPNPRPLDVSPWLAMSVLQKAIRRGRGDLALGAAATLLRDAPDKLWRRVGCIAFEDIGVASLEVVGLATAALAGKQARAALGANGRLRAALSLNSAEPRSAGRSAIVCWPVSFTPLRPTQDPQRTMKMQATW